MKCPLDRPHGEIVCREGYLWALTHSEMGPPDSRQNEGPCRHCNTEQWKREHLATSTTRTTRTDDNAAYRRDMIDAGRGHLLR